MVCLPCSRMLMASRPAVTRRYPRVTDLCKTPAAARHCIPFVRCPVGPHARNPRFISAAALRTKPYTSNAASTASDEDDDGVAGLYNPADDPEIEDMLRRWERGEVITPQSTTDIFGVPDPMQQAREMQRRKAAVLMDLIRAGSGTSDSLQERLKHHQAELDPHLIAVLEGRIQAGVELGEPRESQDMLRDLHQALCAEVQRTQASPAMRLLDALLDMLGGEVGTQEYEARKEQCLARMQEAFTGQVGGIDIFRAAAAFASREPLTLDQFQVERVAIHDFMEECRELLTRARQEQQEVKAQLDAADKKLERINREQPHLLDRPDMQQRVIAVDQVRAAWERRQVVAIQLEDVLMSAEALKAHMVAFLR